jgi:TolB protein
MNQKKHFAEFTNTWVCGLLVASAVFVTLSGQADSPDEIQITSPLVPIVFDSRQSGFEEVYVADYEGSGVHRITHTKPPGFSCCPRWSPDHLQIAFISDRDGDEELYVMNADGGNVRRLTHNPGFDWSPAWTPDGTQIAFLWGPENHAKIYLINVDGTDQQLLGGYIGEASGDLSWSSDGERLLFTSQRNNLPEQTFEVNIKTKVVRQLIHGHETSISANASWSPFGDEIVFTSDRFGQLEILRMGLDGSNLRRLTQSPKGRTGSWAFAQSPDGSHIVFSSDRLGDSHEFRDNMEIYVIKADGSNLQRITSNQWMDAHPDW